METTEVFVGNAFYPNGTNISINPEACCDVKNAGNGVVLITHHESSVSVNVQIASL